MRKPKPHYKYREGEALDCVGAGERGELRGDTEVEGGGSKTRNAGETLKR